MNLAGKSSLFEAGCATLLAFTCHVSFRHAVQPLHHKPAPLVLTANQSRLSDPDSCAAHTRGTLVACVQWWSTAVGQLDSPFAPPTHAPAAARQQLLRLDRDPAGTVLAGAEHSVCCTRAAVAAAAAAAAATALTLSAHRTAAAQRPHCTCSCYATCSTGSQQLWWMQQVLKQASAAVQLHTLPACLSPRWQAAHHGRQSTADVMSNLQDTRVSCTCGVRTSGGCTSRLGFAACCAGPSAMPLMYSLFHTTASRRTCRCYRRAAWPMLLCWACCSLWVWIWTACGRQPAGAAHIHLHDYDQATCKQSKCHAPCAVGATSGFGTFEALPARCQAETHRGLQQSLQPPHPCSYRQLRAAAPSYSSLA